MEKKNKGITLITLIMTVIILLIIAGLSINYGINTYKSSKVMKFETYMKILDTLQQAKDYTDNTLANSTKIDKKIVPVIGTDEAFQSKGGNRLTKTNTIACRGSKHTELAKYGSEFNIIQHPSKEGLFILKSTTEIEEQELEDIDIDLQDIIDNDVKEIDSNFFKL